jgi:opacity protein-like surface antigen
MKKCIPFIGGAVLFALTASAQDWPRYETYLGYTYVRANSATNIPSFSANGGSGQFVYNFDKWFGVVLDLGAVHNGNIHGVHLDSTAANFLLGPRLTLRKRSRFTPYVQTLFGGVYATTSTGVDAALLVPGVRDVAVLPPGDFLRFTRDQTAFAMTAGGGLDIRINRHVTFRPFQLEYFLTHLHDFPRRPTIARTICGTRPASTSLGEARSRRRRRQSPRRVRTGPPCPPTRHARSVISHSALALARVSYALETRPR